MGVFKFICCHSIALFNWHRLYFKAVRVVYLNGETTASIDDHIYFENSVIKSGAFKCMAQAQKL